MSAPSSSVNLRAEREAVSAALAGQARKVLGYCRPEDFSDKTNEEILWAIEELVRAETEVTVASVYNTLRLHDKLNPDSITFVEHAAEVTITSGEAAATLVSELAARRRLSKELREKSEALDDGTLTSSEAAAEITSRIFQIASPNGHQSKPIAAASASMELELDRLAQGNIVGYTTSMHGIDQMIMGVLPSEFLLITGPQSSCKSLLGQKMLLTNAIAGIPGALYTLEMSIDQWMKRCIAMLSHTLEDAKQLRGTLEPGVPSLNAEQIAECRQLNQYLATLPLYLEEKKHGLYEICEDLTRRVEHDGVQIGLVDYMQIIQNGSSNGSNRTEQISAISRVLRSLALRLNIIIIGIAKLDKAGSGAALRGEELFGHEMEGSSSLGYDASIIFQMMMKKPELLCDCAPEVMAEYKRKHKGEPKHKTNEMVSCSDCQGIIHKSERRIGWVSIPKCRDGEIDDRIPLVFHGKKLLLEEVCSS